MNGRLKAHSIDISQPLAQEKGQVRAVLGPTNTGKTYFAIDRMLGHESGMIGFPLRLLARENYDRIVALKGTLSVALITGEEKIIPANPRWFVCTVESMPLDRQVEFLAVDEIQLCADVDRGHVFTDRLLHARGVSETIFLGSDTMAPILRALVPNIRIDERLRMSTLSYAGSSNLTRLPRRSAIVGFSVSKVYELAERVRRQRGGAAVVLGALSPRTRNAQVEMYQAGEVDYMVATDAIGMGLNMDVTHVAFSGLRKFDGRRSRALAPVEAGQIAGRAGRYMNDGSFGTTAGYGPLRPELVEAIESHRFDPVKTLFWRSRDLDFRSPKLLLRSLGHAPERLELTRAREAEDHMSLAALTRDEDMAARASDPSLVRLLWDVCQIPDFRKIMPDHHVAFLGQVFAHLSEQSGRLPEDWVGAQINRLETTTGDIDALTGRLADIRTWTYISHRGDWLDDSAYWQGRAGAIEDRLSDALHERLTHRFVDRRAASIDRKRGAGAELLSAVTARGDVVVEGQTVGQMQGIAFVPLESLGLERRMVLSAARRAAMQDIAGRVRRLVSEPDSAFALGEDGRIAWQGIPVARLAAGPALLSPEIRIVRSDLLDNGMRSLIQSRLTDWLTRQIDRALKPLVRAREAALEGPARGVVYRLCEHMGGLPGALDDREWHALSKSDRQGLAALGVRMSPASVYLKGLQSEAAQRIRRILWEAHRGRSAPAITVGDISCPAGAYSKADWAALGYARIGVQAIRFENLDKLARLARQKSNQGTFLATSEMTSLVGVKGTTFEQIMAALGYAARKDGAQTEFRLKSRKRLNRRRQRTRKKPIDPNSPFASLRDLAVAK
ncbi:MAG: helicase-related protein [Rickettsiales bacterium]